MGWRPKIGITCDQEHYTDRRGIAAARYQLSFGYVTSVVHAGGLPVLLPDVPREDLDEVIATLDGLVLSGGDFDIPPSFYGQPVQGARSTLYARSAFELELFRRADARGLPVLGICGGMQLINVARGGTLIQDLATQAATSLHEQPHDRGLPAHPVASVEATRVRALCGPTLSVNSTHHQAVDQVGADLVVSGFAEDGVIEAIEDPSRPFLVGVQWHPEAMYARDGHQVLYDQLVAAADRPPRA